MDFHQFSLAFMAFFAITNPISNLPVFLSLTDGLSKKDAKTVAFRSLTIAMAIVITFTIFGTFIFQLFGITIAAFQIAGGFIIFLMGFHMVQGNTSSIQHSPTLQNTQIHQDPLSVAISPLGTPLLAGPGAIATTINLSTKGNTATTLEVILAFALLSLIIYFTFIYGQKLITYLGQTGMKVMTRMMGLILAVIGVQMMLEGLQIALHIPH